MTANDNLRPTPQLRHADGILLADVVNGSPLTLPEYDMAELTHFYDGNYIEKEAMRILKLEDWKLLHSIIETRWQLDVLLRREGVKGSLSDQQADTADDGNLSARLVAIDKQVQLLHELRQQYGELMSKWTAAHSQQQEEPEVQTTEAAQTPEQAGSPAAAQVVKIDEQPFRVLITSLPKDLQPLIKVPQDVFDVFVKQLNDVTWPIVNQSRQKHVDPLRFLCNYENITDRKTKRWQFDSLLHLIVKELHESGSLVCSMTRMTLTKENSMKNLYQCYTSADINKDKRAEIQELWDACQRLKPSLEPVFALMKEKKSSKKS